MTNPRRRMIRRAGATTAAVAATGTAVAVWPRCPDAPERGDVIVPVGDPALGLYVLENDGQIWLQAQQTNAIED